MSSPPLYGARPTAKPKRESFVHSSDRKLRCPLCNYTGSPGWADHHATRTHYLCTCGGWFLSISQHIAQRTRRGISHP